MQVTSARLRHWAPAGALLALVAASALGLAVPALAQAPASAPGPAAVRASVKPNIVSVIAHEYAFTMADSLPAGLTTFRLDDQGKELHHITLVRLDSGKTISDLMAAMKTEGAPPPAWMQFVGGPNTPEPGSIANATLNLTPGYYVAL